MTKTPIVLIGKIPKLYRKNQHKINQRTFFFVQTKEPFIKKKLYLLCKKCVFCILRLEITYFILNIGYKSHKIVIGRVKEQARSYRQPTQYRKRSKRFQPLDLHSHFISLSLPSDLWVCRYSNKSPPFCSILKELIRVSRFQSKNRTFLWIVESEVCNPSPPWKDSRGAWWCLWRWRESSRRGWRIGGRRLTSQLSGKMGSSSLSVELTLLSQPSLLYDSLSLSLSLFTT